MNEPKTYADKYLKDGTDVIALAKEYLHFVHSKVEFGEEYNSIDMISDFFASQPKPTLTGDEKVILNKINTDIYAKIGRHKCGEIIFRNVNDSYVVITPYFRFENMFQFIKPRRRI